MIPQRLVKFEIFCHTFILAEKFYFSNKKLLLKNK